MADPDFIALLLIGSCARGTATYRSDIDLLIVARDCHLDYGRVVEWRNRIEGVLETNAVETVLPCQFTFVLSSVRTTSEPAMRQALAKSIVLYSINSEWAIGT